MPDPHNTPGNPMNVARSNYLNTMAHVNGNAKRRPDKESRPDIRPYNRAVDLPPVSDTGLTGRAAQRYQNERIRRQEAVHKDRRTDS